MSDVFTTLFAEQAEPIFAGLQYVLRKGVRA